MIFIWKAETMRHSEGRVLLKRKYLHMHTHVNNIYSLSHTHIKPKTWQEKQNSCLLDQNQAGLNEISKLVNTGSWNRGRYILARKPKRTTSQTTNWAQRLVQSDLDQGCLLRLLKMTLQGIHLSCSLLHKVLERPLQFTQKPQHLSVLLRGQVLSMLGDKHLSIKSKSIQLRFPFSHGLFQILK